MPNANDPDLALIKNFKAILKAVKQRDTKVVRKALETNPWPLIYIRGLGPVSFVSYLAFQGDEGALQYINTTVGKLNFPVIKDIIYGYALAGKQEKIQFVMNGFYHDFIPNADKSKVIQNYNDLESVYDKAQSDDINVNKLKMLHEVVYKGGYIAGYTAKVIPYWVYKTDNTQFFSAFAGRLSSNSTYPGHMICLAQGGHIGLLNQLIDKYPEDRDFFKKRATAMLEETNYPTYKNIEALAAYINKRSANKEEYFYFFSSFFGGFSRTQKLAAAQSLLDVLVDSKPLSALRPHMRVLEQGELGKIFAIIKPKLEFLAEPEQLDEQPKTTLTARNK